MLPNLKALLNNRPLGGLAGRIESQVRQIDAMLPVQSAVIDQSLAMPITAVPPLNQVPIDANKIAEGRPVAESIEMNGL